MINKAIILVIGSMMSVVAMAGDPPSIGGTASISAEIQGAIANGGAAASGSKVTLKQSVASVLHGSVGGTLNLSVMIKGAIVNVGAAASGAEVTACQSVGTIGSDC